MLQPSTVFVGNRYANYRDLIDKTCLMVADVNSEPVRGVIVGVHIDDAGVLQCAVILENGFPWQGPFMSLMFRPPARLTNSVTSVSMPLPPMPPLPELPSVAGKSSTRKKSPPGTPWLT